MTAFEAIEVLKTDMGCYEYFRWDTENEEYVCETDDKCFLSTVPWHHLRDFVEIVE